MMAMDSNELTRRLVEYGIDELPPDHQLIALFRAIDEQEARIVDYLLDKQLLRDRGRLIDMLTALIEPLVDAAQEDNVSEVRDRLAALVEAYYDIDARNAGD